MDQCSNIDPGSEKDLRRNHFQQKKLNNFVAARRPFTQSRVWRNSQQWKESMRVTQDFRLPTIFEDKFEPHFGLSSVAQATLALDVLSKFANVDLPDKVVREIEGLTVLIFNLTQQATPSGALSSILLWIQGRTTKSLYNNIKGYLEEILFTSQSSQTPDWLECLRDVRHNWQLCKDNRAFRQVSKLIGCLATLGLCDVANLEFSIGNFKVFTPEMFVKHMSAVDIADALFETVVFFTEGAFMCFQTGSLRPLLINDKTAMELDEEYAQVCAWYSLVQHGNLQRFADMSDQEFEKRLNKLSTSLRNLSQTLKGIEKKLIMDKFQKILIMQNDFVALKVACGVRHAPWAIELFGESSQGKTTLGDQLIDAVLTSQGLPTSKEYRCAYNAGDKFMSNWTSERLVLIFDDISNDKSGFVERPPTRAVVDAINNQMYYAPKAELDAKGKCFVEPWIVLATTNKKDMDAGLYSNCPYSIQRRMICLTVCAKREFQRMENGVPCGIDPTKVREFYTKDGTYSPPMFDDIWTVTIERAVKPKNLTSVAGYAPIIWKDKVMKDISMAECIQWAIEDFDAHKMNQESLLDGMRSRQFSMVCCSFPGCKHLKGNCPYHEEQQFGKETVSACYRCFGVSKCLKRSVDMVYDRADVLAAEFIYKKGTQFLDNWDWIKCVPSVAFTHPYFSSLCKFLYADELKRDCEREMWCIRSWFVFLCVLFFFLFDFQFALLLVCFCLLDCIVRHRNVVDNAEKRLLTDLSQRNLQIAPMLRKYRDEYAKYICGLSFGIAALYAISRAYHAFRHTHTQGALEPQTAAEVKSRDEEPNVWTNVKKRELPVSPQSKRISGQELSNVVQGNLLYGTIHKENGNGMVNGLMLKTGVILMPNHYFTEFGAELNCTFRRSNPESSGGHFDCHLNIDASVLIPNTDLRICYVSRGGSYRNIIKYFPYLDLPSLPFFMYWRKKDGEFVVAKGVTDPGLVATISSFKGGMYKNLTIDTFSGLCGATLVSDTVGSTILGVHLGGTAGTPRGCYGSIYQSEINAAISQLRWIDGTLISSDDTDFRSDVLGVKFLEEKPLHTKSPLRFMPHGSQVKYVGSCIGRSVMKTSVKVTPISWAVTEHCGQPNIYGPPKFNPDWFGWQNCLANLAIPATEFSFSLLQKAVVDYKTPLLELCKSDLWKDARPLTMCENINGIPGKKFMDAIKMDTALGYPLVGVKRNRVIELDPIDGYQSHRTFDESILGEIEFCEKRYLKGERAYPIAKACKKDEILTKEKCRIFYGNALSLTFLIRKYYLPILRILQMNPLISECAVGINSHGPEWDQFYKHATKYGLDRLIGGDYKAYDQKLPSQLILAAFRILIDCARVCDYSSDDIRVMESIASDVVYAYVAFNGDLVEFTSGTHISGNSLTVIINGICGSLNLRCCYYGYGPTRYRPFRDAVALMTYGDDNIGSVAADVNSFTIKTCSHFLSLHGQEYTMPDKTSDMVDFLPVEEFEFLKRINVYHPDLQCNVGALLEKSIFKSLHCFMRDKNTIETEEYASAVNVDGALREWFNHGSDVFEARRRQMVSVAEQCGITHMCCELHKTYDERVLEWHLHYTKTSSMSLKDSPRLIDGVLV
nr:MAG: putative nonstructural protein [Salisharnavirus sp.]